MRKPKKIRFQPAQTAPRDEGVLAIRKIYRLYHKLSDGAEGGVSGVSGSVRPMSLARILRALKVRGKGLVDFGAGSGRVLFSAILEGASRSYGYELPVNEGMKALFDSVCVASSIAAPDSLEWIGKDILDIVELNGRPSCAFSFWVGLPYPVQEHVLDLCSKSASIKAIAVFKYRKWGQADEGLLFMHYSSASMIFFHIIS